MKKYLKIFAVLTVVCIFVPSNVWGGDDDYKCKPVACHGDNSDAKDVINVNVDGGIIEGSGQCFFCEDGYAEDDQCGQGHIAGQKNSNGFVTSIYSCADVTIGNDRWDITRSNAICESSQLKLITISDNSVKNYVCTYSLDNGSTYDYSRVVGASTTAGSSAVCVMCRCRGSFVPNADKTDCVVDPTPKNTCENAPSYGRWNGTKCQCGSAGWGRGKGVGQVDKVSGATCQCAEPDKMRFNTATNNCECNDQKMEVSADGKCVKKPEVICNESGGTWNATETPPVCECDDSKHLELDADNKKCKCKDHYEWIDPSNKWRGCKLTDEAMSLINEFDQLMRECEAWGGTWSGDSLDRKSWECKCPDNEQSYPGVVQNGPVKCRCQSPEYFEENYKCIDNSVEKRKKNCDKAKNDGQSVKWQEGRFYGTSQGVCVCTDPNKIYSTNTQECIDIPRTPHNAGVGAGAPVQQDVSGVTQDIENLDKRLRNISDKFQKSHWKNASGGFNTSRLASDSVAGVVLGTLGGVITSNIIKKNQTKSGFENMQCVVGGQSVADYGDQFRVGIQ